MEQYQVNIHTSPFESEVNFIKGAVFGYNIGDVDTERTFYWDGNDYWIDSQHKLKAIFKGTLKFYPKGVNIHPNFDSKDYYPTPINLQEDSLVLDIWPRDYLKLNEILPEGSPIPKSIVFQNVDKSHCIIAAKNIIDGNKDYYRHIFKEENENVLPNDETLSIRINTWLNNSWAIGEGNGVLVDYGNEIGQLSSGRPTYTQNHTNNTIVPEGANDKSCLTLKVATIEGIYFNPSFLIYLLTQLENDQFNIIENNGFTRNAITEVLALPKIRVFYHTKADIAVPENVPDDAVSAYPDKEVWIQNDTIQSKIPALYDHFALESKTGYWRMQGFPPPGNFMINCSASFLFRRPNEEFLEYSGLHVRIVRNESVVSLQIQEPDPWGFINVSNRWLQFGDEHKFVLGVNMESLRQQHYHDLSGNTLFVSKNPTSGQYSITPGYETGWIDSEVNRQKLREDFRTLKILGVSCVRIWVFEYLEGIDFNFNDYLNAERKKSDDNQSAYLRTRVFPRLDKDGNPITPPKIVHACDKIQFEDLLVSFKNRLTQEGKDNGRLKTSFYSTNGIRQSIESAKFILDQAEANGLKILWTLFTHFGEGFSISLGQLVKYSTFIYYSRDVNSQLPNDATDCVPSLMGDHRDWHRLWDDFYKNNTFRNDNYYGGRLPIEAWLYRAVLVDEDLRSSLMTNVVDPFVQECVQYKPNNIFGFELMNESDIIWDETKQSWQTGIKGGVLNYKTIEKPGNFLEYGNSNRDDNLIDILTNWKLSETEIRHFLSECVNTIRRHWSGCVTSSVMGQNDHMVFKSLELLRPESDNLILDFSSISRYALALNWESYFDGQIDLDNDHTFYPHRVTDFERNRRVINSFTRIHNSKIMFSEAGDMQLPPGRPFEQRDAVSKALKAAIRLGYAGIFMWHYNDPDRSSESDENNPLTLFREDSNGSVIPPSSIPLRPAALEIRDFVDVYQGILLHQLI